MFNEKSYSLYQNVWVIHINEILHISIWIFEKKNSSSTIIKISLDTQKETITKFEIEKNPRRSNKEAHTIVDEAQNCIGKRQISKQHRRQTRLRL